MAACGTERPDLSMTPASEGLVIAADGTIYSSRSGGVARTRPGMATEANWVRLTGATTVWGLALDVANRRLYVGSPGNATVFAVDYTADPPTSTAHLAMAGQPNGLTMGPDGALYYSDFGGGHVYRVEAAGMRTRVTRTPIAQANGLAFAPDRTLYVNGYGAGQVFRLTLDAMGAETERAMVATGAGGADGLALDAMGRLYVTAQGSGSLLRYNADGTGRTVLRMGMTSPANVEFGAGSLNCSDIYIATGGRPGVVMVEGGTAERARERVHPWRTFAEFSRTRPGGSR
jgi:sugar lactone lactonase YvrE